MKNNNDFNDTPVKKSSSRVTQDDIEEAENALNDRLMGVVGASDDFRASYWPMEKWINDKAITDMLNVIVSTYPNLNWNNPLSSQFTAMLSAVQNIAWITELRTQYDFGIVDFMRILFMNWPELFTRKKYASSLSAAIVSVLTNNGELP